MLVLLTQKSLRDEEMTSLTGVMKRINIISDLRARVKRACDCGFLHWHRVGKLSERAEDWPATIFKYYILLFAAKEQHLLGSKIPKTRPTSENEFLHIIKSLVLSNELINVELPP